MARKGDKYITIYTYRGVIDKVTGVPKNYRIRIKDYDEGMTEKVLVEKRRR